MFQEKMQTMIMPNVAERDGGREGKVKRSVLWDLCKKRINEKEN